MNISAINYANSFNRYRNFDNTVNPEVQPATAEPSFKAGKAPKKPGKIKEFFARTYGKAILNSNSTRNFCEWFSKLDKNDASRHFQVIGSAVTSSAYMKATMSNKDIEKKNATTLAVNQLLGFIVPTVAAYTVDAGMKNFNKQLEYSYSARKEKEIALKKLTEAEKNNAVKALGNQLKGFRCLIGIVTFTAIYRYAAPVLITPVANWIGNKLNAKNDAKQAAAEASKTEEKQAA